MAIKYKEKRKTGEKTLTKKEFDDACKDCNFNMPNTHKFKTASGVQTKTATSRKLIYGRDGKIIGLSTGWS